MYSKYMFDCLLMITLLFQKIFFLFFLDPTPLTHNSKGQCDLKQINFLISVDSVVTDYI